MALIRADRVKETSTTTGTGALTLAGAMTGFQAFSAVCTTNDTCWYCIQAVDGGGSPTGDWEVGLGTYSGVNTLTRTTVYASSNSGSAVSLASGTKQVFITFAGEKCQAADATFYTPPVQSSFSWVNQGTASETVVDTGVTLHDAAANADTLRCRVMTAPSTPYQAVIHFTGQLLTTNYEAIGLVWRDSASGKLQTWHVGLRNGRYMGVINWNSATSYNGDQTTFVFTDSAPNWLRIRDDGTSRYCEASTDGQTWIVVRSFTRTSFLTPDQVGYFINPTNGNSFTLAMTVHHWYAGT